VSTALLYFNETEADRMEAVPPHYRISMAHRDYQNGWQTQFSAPSIPSVVRKRQAITNAAMSATLR
jgi:hypothetical protein